MILAAADDSETPWVDCVLGENFFHRGGKKLLRTAGRMKNLTFGGEKFDNDKHMFEILLNICCRRFVGVSSVAA